MKIILDTDVFIAALRSRTGASAEIVRRILVGQIELVLSVAVALEYEAVMLREVHLRAAELSKEDALRVLDTLLLVAIPVEPHYRWRPQLSDPDDEMILEAAVNGQADAIVTFNTRDFAAVSSRFSLDVIKPAEALRKLNDAR